MSDSEEDEITENGRVDFLHELDQAILNLNISLTRSQQNESSETVSINRASTPLPAISEQTQQQGGDLNQEIVYPRSQSERSTSAD